MSKAVITLDSRDFEERQSCPCCGGRSFRLVGPNEPLLPAREACAAGEVKLAREVVASRRLVECVDCSAWFASHIPTPAATLRINDAPSYVEEHLPDPRRHSFERGWEAVSKRATTGRVLDIGASGGTFLRGLKGWNTTALEPSQNAAQALSFVDQLIVSDIESLSDSVAPFDVVSMFDVAEHLRRPSQTFQTLARLVKPGGWLIIETGDRNSRLAAAGPLWYYVRYLSHFTFFNRKALETLLGMNGFVLEDFRQVYHSDPDVMTVARVAPRLLMFQAVTLGRRKLGHWVRLADRLSRAGAAPAGPWPDHFFAVARRTLS